MSRREAVLRQLKDLDYWVKIYTGTYIYKADRNYTYELVLVDDYISEENYGFLFVTHYGIIGFERELYYEGSVEEGLKKLVNELKIQERVFEDE